MATARPPNATLSKKFDGSSSMQIFRHLLAGPGPGFFEKAHLGLFQKTVGDNKLDLPAFKVMVGQLFSRG